MRAKTVLMAMAAVSAVWRAAAAPAPVTVEGADGGRLQIVFCRADLVHFRYAPQGEAFADPAEAAGRQLVEKTDADYGEVDVRKGTAPDGRIEVASDALAVRVDRGTLGLSVFAGGREVFASGAAPFAARGAARKASFRRDVAGRESFFGLGNMPGNAFTSLELRDRTFELWLTADNVHAVVPLWYSSSGYGVYSCNSNRGRVSFAAEDYALEVDGGALDFYFIWGPSFKRILSNWSELAGRMNMPPLYALGLAYRGAGGLDDKRLLAIVKEQLDDGFKIDIAGVEPGWHTRAYPCSFAWSGKFKDPKGFIGAMHAMGVKVNFWEHPYFSPDSPYVKEVEPYGVWSKDLEGHEKTRFGFGGLVPDLTVPDMREVYWKIHRDALFDIGADGLKIDETDDWGVGDSLSQRLPGGIACNAYHNIIGTLACNTVHARFRRDFNRRTFCYSRGNWAGMQRWASTAYTDFYGFAQFVMSVTVQSYSGTYYTPEIRDVSTPSDIDYMRRAQMMFLTPFPMSNEWQGETCVTRRSAAVRDCYRAYNSLHYALIPYVYSLFREQNLTGVGVVRALPFEFQDDPDARGVSGQFMLGPSLLVCPVDDRRRTAVVPVYLPAGADWIDVNDGYVRAGGATVRYTSPAGRLPLFVRKGAVIPLGHFGRNTSEVTDPTFTLAVFPDARPASFTVYEDDGISFDYTRGKFAETPVAASVRDGAIRVDVSARRGAFRVPARDCELRIHYRARPAAVKLDGRPLAAAVSRDALRAARAAGWFYGDEAGDFDKILYVRFPDDGRAHAVEAAVPAEPAQTAPAAVPEGDLYECEAPGNARANVLVSDIASASGGKLVRALGGLSREKRGTVTLRGVKAAEAGVYEAELVYANGEAERPLEVVVNGGEPLRVTCPGSGAWDAVTSIVLKLALKAGENEIALGVPADKDWGPDVDALILYADKPVADALPGRTVSPARAEVFGGARVARVPGAVGFAEGLAVSGLDGKGGRGVKYTVRSEADGPFQLFVSYANRAARCVNLMMKVNGAWSELALQPTYSDQIASVTGATVYLKRGDNEIRLYAEDGSAGDVRLGAISVK